jgi:uncharacterized membrane protein
MMDKDASEMLNTRFASKMRYFKVSTFFLIFALVFGVMWIFVTPPFQSPDEQAHFFRIYQISCGQLFPLINNDGVAGGLMPKSIVRIVKEFCYETRHNPEKHVNVHKIFEYLHVPLEPMDVQFQAFPTHAYYTPFAYLPQTLAVFFCRILKCPPLIMLYIGRLFNLSFWIFIIYFLIKAAPAVRWLLFIVCLMPMHLFLASSVSQDTVVNIYSLVFISLTLLLMDKSAPVKIQRWLLLFLVAFCLSLSKFVYSPLILLLLLIPSDNYPKHKKWFILGFFYVVCIFGLILWLNYNNPVSTSLYHYQQTPTNKFKWILMNPFNFIVLNVRTLWNFKFLLMQSFIGNLGWLDAPLPYSVTFFYGATILLVVLFLVNTHFTVMVRIFLFSIFMICLLSLHGSVYFFFNSIHESKIKGLQGRYYISIFPVLFLALSGLFKSINRNFLTLLKIFIILATFITLSTSTYILFNRYWF